MELQELQKKNFERTKKIGFGEQRPLEIVAGIAEELGEVVTEVALFEQIGSKVNWDRKADKKMLAKEISHLMVNILSLASCYDIDLEETMSDLMNEEV